MKNVCSSILFILLVTNIGMAQRSDYEKAMTEAINSMQAANTIEKWQAVENRFERIALVASGEWYPLYYQAYASMVLASAYMNKEDMESCNKKVDKAQEILDKAQAIGGENSEILALQSFIYQGRIWKNPMVAGAKYSPLSHKAADKAIDLDPNNPRPYYLKGQNTLFTPSFFGGGAKHALPFLEKAAELYAAEAGKERDGFAPAWGQDRTEMLIKQAKDSLK